MHRSTRTLRASLLAVAALAAFPAASMAATSSDSTDATTTVGEELSIDAPATVALSALTHAAPATGSATVSVTSTAPSWTITATDAAASGKGYMVNADGTRADLALDSPLAVTPTDGGAAGDLTSTGVTTLAGAMNDSKTFQLSQSLGATEDVVANDSYTMTIVYTATTGV